MTRIKQATFGADIELFVSATQKLRRMVPEKYIDPTGELHVREVKRTQTVSTTIVPCVGLFKGTKAKPHTPKGWKPGYAIQEDNVMLEFNIPPAKNAGEFSAILKQAKHYVTKECKKQELIPMWDVPEFQFRPIDLTTPQAKLFGCEPDMDAYTGGTQRDTIPNFGRYRTCGGHIHMGGDFNCPDFVAVLFLELVLALYLGSQFVIRPQSQRAKWYGKPGVYRSKPYGIEYRTLSNAWITDQYTIGDIGTVLFKVADTLISNSAQTLQQWFRRIEWTVLQDALLGSNAVSKEERQVNNQRWHTLRQQFNALQIPGLGL